MADLDVSGAAAAGKIRVRRRQPTRNGGRLDGVWRMPDQRIAGATLAAVLERACAQLLHDRRLGGAAEYRRRTAYRAQTGSDRQALQAAAWHANRGRPRR